MEHVRSVSPAGVIAEPPAATVELPSHLRHLRRKLLYLSDGETVMLDLERAVALRHGDRLVRDDGLTIEVHAAPEPLSEITARDSLHLTELAWHIGNRHLAAEIRAGRVLVLRDQVIKTMLEGLGATVRETVAPFHPMNGAYGAHGHSHHG